MSREATRKLTLLLALVTAGCFGSRTLNTFDDIREFGETIAGSPTTAADRLRGILQAHDRTDALSWPLLPDSDGDSQLRPVLRAIAKIEGEPFKDLTGRAKSIAVLAGVAEHSASDLVRSRSTLAIARLGKSLALDPPEMTQGPTDAVLTAIFDLLKLADGAVPKKDRPETPELRKTRRDALDRLAEYRFWPPESFRFPAPGTRDEFLNGRRWTQNLIGYYYRGLRFLPDLQDPAFAPTLDVKLDGLVAEYVRYEVTRAMLRDPDRNVRYDAVGSLLVLGTGDLVPPLAAAADEEPADLVRLRIAQAIAEIGPKNRSAAIPALIRRLTDHRTDVRHAAYDGLRELTGQDLGEDVQSWVDWWSTQAPMGR